MRAGRIDKGATYVKRVFVFEKLKARALMRRTRREGREGVLRRRRRGVHREDLRTSCASYLRERRLWTMSLDEPNREAFSQAEESADGTKPGAQESTMHRPEMQEMESTLAIAVQSSPAVLPLKGVAHPPPVDDEEESDQITERKIQRKARSSDVQLSRLEVVSMHSNPPP